MRKNNYTLYLCKDDIEKRYIDNFMSVDYAIWFILDEIFPGAIYKDMPDITVMGRYTDNVDYNQFILEKVKPIKLTSDIWSGLSSS